VPRILFCKTGDPFGCFSNFSAHPVVVDGLRWPTTEHYFQAAKFVGADSDHAAAILAAVSPMTAARMGRSRAHPIRADWDAVKDDVMRRAVRAKVEQHVDVRRTLAETGDAEIVEHTPRDAYWGDGPDGTGRNMLGRILMELRAEVLDPERVWKKDAAMPLLGGPDARLLHEHYTAENICRAMGIVPFAPAPQAAGWAARVLLKPSLSEETCVTIVAEPGRAPLATVHALAEHLYSKRFPTFPEHFATETVGIDTDLAGRLFVCLTDGHSVSSEVCLDGIGYDAAVRTPAGVTYRAAHVWTDRPVEAALRALVPVLHAGAAEPICRRALAGVARHIGLTLG
jgi:ribA/ribD-fused uncharacterized protein